ncbi:MAG: CAP domain-containing protein [Bacteroidetes bacterium]|nr:CAP domain-containing protein [Bacteroidota bacterium]
MYKAALRTILSPFVVIALFFSVSCTRSSTPARNTTPSRSISTVNMNADIINLVNQIRETKHLPPLKLLQSASYQAARHSEDMAAKRVPFGHDGFKQRAIAIADDLNGSSATGENVATGKMTAKEVVAAWLKSSAHRANIQGDFTYTGVGVARDSRGVIYYTQLFVKK